LIRVTRLVAALLGLVTITLPGAPALADSPVSLTAPTNLSMSLPQSTQPVAAGGWIASTRLALHFQVQVDAGTVIPEVEVQPSSKVFTGQPNFTGATMSTSGPAVVTVRGFTDATSYHWQARVSDTSGKSSAWTTFSAAGSSSRDFGVDLTPPSRPLITSPTNPSQNLWYNSRLVRLHWTSHDVLSGIAGYSYVLEHKAQVIPPGSVSPNEWLSVSSLADGVWFVAVRAVDKAGNWSPTATYRLLLDRQPPKLIWLSPRRFTFNPFRGPTAMRFEVTKSALVRMSLYRVGSKTPTAVFSFPHLAPGQVTTISWSGKTGKNKPAPNGYYFFSATAVDQAHNTAHVNLGGISLRALAPQVSISGQQLFPDGGKLIIVSLSRQTLYAYDGTKLALQTYVTTGNPELPTPPGSYSVMVKYHPFEFNSPWPPGSPFWYPPSWVQYAMLFRAGGYFLHDAPWRSDFGPGTNGPGQPGTNYGGTHGCVNIPPDPMLFLWNWTPVGTPVDVDP
jgi:lipoprotein-anchoring transpeptidase ErfK/SrfK